MKTNDARVYKNTFKYAIQFMQLKNLLESQFFCLNIN